MKLFIWLRINWKYLLIGLMIAGALFGLIFFDALRGLDDRKIQINIEENLPNERLMSVRDLIPNATALCILPPYALPESIKASLSDKQMTYLSRRINSFIGVGDHVWWLVSLGQNEAIQVYRMAGSARPSFKSGKCLSQQDSVIIFDRKNGYTFFNFLKRE